MLVSQYPSKEGFETNPPTLQQHLGENIDTKKDIDDTRMDLLTGVTGRSQVTPGTIIAETSNCLAGLIEVIKTWQVMSRELELSLVAAWDV